MATYLVKVKTEHLERYYVEAGSEDEARMTWMDSPMDMSECIEVLGIDSVEEAKD